MLFGLVLIQFKAIALLPCLGKNQLKLKVNWRFTKHSSREKMIKVYLYNVNKLVPFSPDNIFIRSITCITYPEIASLNALKACNAMN